MTRYYWRFNETFDPCDGLDGGRDLTPEQYAAACDQFGEPICAAHWQKMADDGSLPKAKTAKKKATTKKADAPADDTDTTTDTATDAGEQ